jgi:hypothetical protein
METYRVFYEATASTYIDVEAENADDAADKADEIFEGPDVCAQCAGYGQDTPGIELGDWEPCTETPAPVQP